VPRRTFFRDKVIEDRLGAYVYFLVHPVTKRPFYVGKAGGLDAQGNTRPDAHLSDTLDALHRLRPLSKKEQVIADLWDAGLEPVLAVARRQIESEDTASEVEATLIDVIRHFYDDIEGNKYSGRHFDRGLLIGDGIAARVSAPVVNPTIPIHDVWVFNIINSLRENSPRQRGIMNPTNDELYNAVRGTWTIGLPPRSGFAVGLVGGIARIVCRVKQWHKLEEKGKTRGLVRFDGEILDSSDPVGSALLLKDFSKLTGACPSWLRKWALRFSFMGDGQAIPTYNKPAGLLSINLG